MFQKHFLPTHPTVKNTALSHDSTVCQYNMLYLVKTWGATKATYPFT